MVFENLNYSTEEKIDEESIQDKIDDKRLDISSLTKENLQRLKVDILQKNSYLKVRDVKGNIISDLKLRDNNVVNFNGDNITHEVDSKMKVFLGVTFEDGKTGYVSADYLKGDKVGTTLSKPNIVDGNTGKQEKPNNKPQVGAGKKIGGENGTEGKKEANKVDLKESNEKNTLENNQRFIFDKGNVYLIGKDGEKITQNIELTPQIKEILKKYEKASILREVIDIWKNQANKTVEGLHWKDSRTDDEIINKKIGDIENKFSSIFEDAQKGKDINGRINEVFQDIMAAENEENIIGANDMFEVKEIVLGSGNKDEKLKKIYNKMRYGGLSGNSETVKEKVAEHLIKSPDFKDVSDILNNESVYEFIKNNNKSDLEQILGKELSDEILNVYTKIKVTQEKHRDEYAEKLAPINEEKRKKGEAEIKLADFIDLNVNYSIQNLLKHSLLERKLENNESRGSENESYSGIYSNMVGLGKNKGVISDKILTISDENIDTAVDVSSTLALSIVSMGVGAIAARGTLAAVSWGAKATGISEGIDSLGKAGSVAKFAGTAGVEGGAFYEGTTITNNLIDGNRSWDAETGNVKEIVKSIAFMGVLRGASKAMEEAKWATGLSGNLSKTEKAFAGIGKLSDKVPALMFKDVSITGVLAEAGLLTGTSVGLEVAFEGEGDWTWEEYLQAIAMVGVMKGAGKITFKKNEGKIEMDTSIKLLEYKPEKIETKNEKVSSKEEAKVEEKAIESKEIINKFNLPKNAEFTINNSNGVDYHFKTGDNGEILAISHLQGKLNAKIKPENFDKILEELSAKNIKFYATKSGQIVYEADGVLYTKNGNKSKAKKENLKELDGGEKVSASVKEVEASKTEEKSEEVGKTEEKAEEKNENNSKVDESKAEEVKPEESKTEETKEEFKAEEGLTKEQIKLKKSLLKNIENIINKEISSIKNGESKNIGTYKIEKSENGKEYKISNGNEELGNRLSLNELKEIIRKDIKINDNLYKFINELNNTGINEKLEKLKGKNIEDNLYYSKTSKGEFVDGFGKKIDIDSLPKETQFKILKDITGFDYSLFIKNYTEKFFNSLSKEGKEKFKKMGGGEGLMKDIKTIFVFPFKLTGYGLGKGMTVSKSFNVFKMHRNLDWKDKIIGGLVASTVYESMGTAQNDKESFYDPKHLANIGINSLNMALFGGLVIFTEPLLNTIYGRFKDFEPRDFLPAYVDNLIGGGSFTGREMPYELGESLLLTDKEILENTINGFKDAAIRDKTTVNPELLNKLEKKLKEVS